MKKRKICIVVVLLLLCGLIIFFLFGRSDNKSLLPTDGIAVEWDGEQKLPTGVKTDDKTIKIPGIGSLTFIANQKEQKVNFYNPKENDCLFRMTLYVDNEQYWQSGYVDPGKGYYDITLDDTLKTGDYNGALLIECFRDEGTALNNARVEFDLKVVEE